MTYYGRIIFLIECNLNVVTPLISNNNNKIVFSSVLWGERSDQQTKFFKSECHKRLRLIDFPLVFSNCSDRYWNSDNHRCVFDKLYSDIVSALSQSAMEGREGRHTNRSNHNHNISE